MHDEKEMTEPPTDAIFERHVFVCTGGDWCAKLDGDGLGVHARLKRLVAEYGLKGRVRVNHAGCLDQCGYGPMVVVYPDAVWYWGVKPDDAETIVREHLIAGRPVERLRYRNQPGKNKLPRDDNGRPIGRPPRRHKPAGGRHPRPDTRNPRLDGTLDANVHLRQNSQDRPRQN